MTMGRMTGVGEKGGYLALLEFLSRRIMVMSRLGSNASFGYRSFSVMVMVILLQPN